MYQELRVRAGGKEMKILLPIEEPPITAYSHLASLFSILWANKTLAMPWICDHFLLLRFVLSGRWATLFDGDSSSVDYADAPFTRYIVLDRRISSPCLERFSDFVELCARNRCFVFAHIDTYYLPCSPCYLKEHFIHQSFIHGFDDEREVVFAADFYGLKYTRVEIGYHDLNQAYAKIALEDDDPVHFRDVVLCQLMPGAEPYKPDLILLRDTLIKYLRGKDEDEKQAQLFLYGVECYRAMAEDAETGYMDIRAYHLLYDHKVLMRHRLEYLRERIERWGKADLVGKNERLIDDALQLRNLVLKYEASSRKPLLGRITEQCLGLMEADRQFTEEFLEFVNSEIKPGK